MIFFFLFQVCSFLKSKNSVSGEKKTSPGVKLSASFGCRLCRGYDPELRGDEWGEINAAMASRVHCGWEEEGGRVAGAVEESHTSPGGAQNVCVLCASLFSIHLTPAGGSRIKLGSGRLESNIAGY